MEKRSQGSPGWTLSQAATASTPLRLRLTLPIRGLDRDGRSARAVEQALERVPGVIRAYANTATEMAYVEFDPAKTTQHDLESEINSVGVRAPHAPGDVR
ncbi:MAG: heavy metal-associated domain-containing protein [Chloroflexota bacterium]